MNTVSGSNQQQQNSELKEDSKGKRNLRETKANSTPAEPRGDPMESQTNLNKTTTRGWEDRSKKNTSQSTVI